MLYLHAHLCVKPTEHQDFVLRFKGLAHLLWTFTSSPHVSSAKHQGFPEDINGVLFSVVWHVRHGETPHISYIFHNLLEEFKAVFEVSMRGCCCGLATQIGINDSFDMINETSTNHQCQ
jgi:hypothetical protein